MTSQIGWYKMLETIASFIPHGHESITLNLADHPHLNPVVVSRDDFDGLHFSAHGLNIGHALIELEQWQSLNLSEEVANQLVTFVYKQLTTAISWVQKDLLDSTQ